MINDKPEYIPWSFKINTKHNGIINLADKQEDNPELLSLELAEDPEDFKVVKTPISNRTFIIGGKVNKTIKEVYIEKTKIENDVLVLY